MGIYSKGILGPISGKVGTVVGASWRDKDCFRSLPRARRTKRVTELQLLHREAFALHAQCAQGLLLAAELGLRNASRKTTALGLLVRRLFEAEGNLGKLRLSSGRYSVVTGLQVENSAGKAVLTWTGPEGAPGDMAVVAVISAEEEFSFSMRVPLSDKRAEIELPEDVLAAYGYAFVVDASGKHVGNTRAARAS